MARRAFGDCIGCASPIAPPYLSFVVQRVEQQPGKDATVQQWEEIDVCGTCAGKLTAEDLHGLVSMPEEEAETVGG